MKIMKKIATFLFIIILSVLIYGGIEVQAVESINSSVVSNNPEIKKGETVELVLKFKDFNDINKGINAFKAKLEYDTNVFEEVNTEDFITKNSWEEFLYNKDNHEFVAIKKAGCFNEEDIVVVILQAKENIEAGKTTICVSNIVASEGKRDIDVDKSEVSLDLIKEQDGNTPVNPDKPEDTEKPDRPTDMEKPSNQDKEDNLAGGSLPQTGISPTFSIILIIIEILIVIAIINFIRIKKINKKIGKGGKTLFTLLAFGLITAQITGTINAAVNRGDVDNSGDINYKDVSLLESHLIDLSKISDENLSNADMNYDNKITVTDLSLLVQKIENKLDYEVKISSNMELDNYYVNKGEEIELKFSAQILYNAKIKEIVINGEAYQVENEENTDNYIVRVKAQEQAGVQEFKFTKVKLDVGKEEKIDYTEKIDILKEKPTIENYKVEELTEEAKLKVIFDIKDNDNSLTSAKIEVLKDNETVTENVAKTGNNEFVLDLEENQKYTLDIYVNYNLDSDELTEHEKDNTGMTLETKELELNIDYNFKIEDTDTTNEDNVVTEIFSKNEPISITFTSINNTKYAPQYAVVNGQKYQVSKVDGNTYKVEISGFNEIGTKEIKLEEIILENGKTFTIENSVFTVNIQKEVPTVENFNMQENDEKINISFNIKDQDNAILSKKIVLEDQDGNQICEENISNNDYSKEIDIPKELVSEYNVKVIADYDITVDASDKKENQIIYETTIKAKARAEISNIELSKEQLEKNENITVIYIIDSNKKEKITKLRVNNIEVDTKNVGDNKYQVIIPVGNVAGKQNIELTRVIFEDKESATVNTIKEIEVLKDKPQITNYSAEDNYDDLKVKFAFDLIDNDNSFVSGKVQLVNKTRTVEQEQEITKAGHVELELPVQENDEYDFKVLVTYARDEDEKLIEEDKELLVEPVQMILDYELEVTDLQTKKEDGTSSKYFERDEKIKLEFNCTTKTKFRPEKVQVNNKEYTLVSLGNNKYEITMDAIEKVGVSDVTIQKIWMNNTKELDTDVTTKIEILKQSPTVKDFKYEETTENKMSVSLELVDEENALIIAKIIIKDGENTVYEENLQEGKNTITFNPTLSETYTAKIIANYDLDSNELESGKNEYADEVIDEQTISIVQELIEIKDVENVQLYTLNTENRVEEVSKINVADFEPSKYIVKVTTKELPAFYAEIEKAEVNNNDFNLILKYDNAVQYDNNGKTNKVRVKFAEIDDGIAQKINIYQLIEKIKSNPTGKITLTDDIDLSDIGGATGNSYFGTFRGTINGNGHTIKNAKKALFDSLEGATIENLIIDNSWMNGNNYRAILSITSKDTTIENVHINNSHLEAWNQSGTGAFAGTAEKTIIKNSSTNNTYVQSNSLVGGFVGELKNGSTIENSYMNNGNVKAWNGNSGGIIGRTSGDILLQNIYAKIKIEIVNNNIYAVGGLVGNSTDRNTTLKNNLSLADSNKNSGKRVIGSNYKSDSTNNYEIDNSTLSTNVDADKIKQIEENNIDESFFKDTLGWNQELWELSNTSKDNLPTLKNLDPKNETNIVKPDRDDVYIPDIARLKGMAEYNSKMEIAYHNMNKLMPFYDAKLYVLYGNKISETDKLNESKIKMIIPYNSNDMAVGLNSDNYNEITKIRIVFEDETTKDYEIKFKKKLSDIAVYTINNLNIDYIPNQFILNKDISIVNEIVEKAKGLDYSADIQSVTPEDESRLYVDYYNNYVKERIDEVILNIMANTQDFNIYLDNDIMIQKVKQEITDNSSLEKTIYTYNYFDKWYNFEIGGINLSDIIFINVNNLNSQKTVRELVNATISQGQSARGTNNTVTFYNNVIKSELDKNIKEFLEYFMKVLANYDNGNDWFTDNFKGMLEESAVKGKEDTIKYRAWELMNKRNNVVLPILSAPQEDMYIISMPTQFIMGSLNRYSQHVNHNDTEMRNAVKQYATILGNFYSTSSTFISGSEGRLNGHVHIQYDTRFNFPGKGNQNKGITEDPVIKWVYEAIGQFAAANGSGAYANGTDVWWVFDSALGSVDRSIKVFTHETAHNQDTYYFYEGNGRRSGTGPEDHADANIAQDLGDGSFVFNIKKDYAATATDSNNLKLDRISSPEKIQSYYQEMFETLYVLDYLTGQAFLRLTPEEQANVAVQVTYPNGGDYNTGGGNVKYVKITADDFRKMNLQTMEDLWDNGIALRNTATITTTGPDGYGEYNGDNHYSIYFYQPHNDNGRPDSHSFKRLGFEMLGIGGYSDGYVTYRSTKSSNDLDALRKITKDTDITWKEYKMNRYENVENNMSKIPYFNAEEVIDIYTEALKKDAQKTNSTRDNSNSLRRALFGIVKRATQDFSTGTIYNAGIETEITSAQQFIDILNSAEWGNYKLVNDIDFTGIETEGNTYISKTFVGRINGNGHKMKGLSKTIFNDTYYMEVQDLEIESPKYSTDVTAIIANTTKDAVLNNVNVTNTNINLPFVKNNKAVMQHIGDVSITTGITDITTKEQFMEVVNSTDQIVKQISYRLQTDIDLSDISSEANAVITGTYTGTFDGNNHTITGLKVPLFRDLKGTVKNLNVNNVTINKSSNNNLAAIAGYSENATLSNIKLNNITITGRENISAVVGQTRNTVMEKISATNINITVGHFYGGGITGRSYDSMFSNIVAEGHLYITETHNGGIIGAINRDNLENIYAKVNIHRTRNGDSRNKNAGLYGAIETGPIGVENVLVVANAEGPNGNDNTLYKITPATTETEKNDITKYLINVYEYENSVGISNASINNNIKIATDEQISNATFYTDTLKWSTDIWDFSKVTNWMAEDAYPKLK